MKDSRKEVVETNNKYGKKLLLRNLPYILMALFLSNAGECIRLAEGETVGEKIISAASVFPEAFSNPLPSLELFDLSVGVILAVLIRTAVLVKGKNRRKYRFNEEYGSARWGNREDIRPFQDDDFKKNIILTNTEFLTMNSRPKKAEYSRNKNVLVIGGSGSGKTRFWLKPNLLQMHSSYVVTDPKGSVVTECGNALKKNGYQIRIFNTVNFKKSMHYNPFLYIHSEKDILKLVTALIANTKGEGSGGDPFWEKSEILLFTALIGYIRYEAPEEEQNFATLIELLNSMEVREDDEEFKNPVDYLFEALERKNPKHFAVRQYKKYKLAAGDICSK